MHLPPSEQPPLHSPETNPRSTSEQPSESPSEPAPKRGDPLQDVPTRTRWLCAVLVVAADTALWRYSTGGYAVAALLLVVLIACNVHAWVTGRNVAPAWSSLLLLGFAARSAYCFDIGVGLSALAAILIALMAVVSSVGVSAAMLAPWLVLTRGWPRLAAIVRAFFGGVGRRVGPWLRTSEAGALLVPGIGVLVFATLLSSANHAFFNHVMAALVALWHVLPNPARFAIWLAFGWLISAALVPTPGATRVLTLVQNACDERPHEAPRHTQVARNLLVALIALFALFMVIDAPYLWHGRAPSGMDTQDYAHEGARVLAGASVLVGIVVAGLSFMGSLVGNVRVLAYGWLAETLMLSLSVLRRMQIHVHWIGLADLHFVGLAGALVVVGGVLSVAQMVRQGRAFWWLVLRGYVLCAAGVAGYVLTPTYELAARYDVARIQAGDMRPLIHVVELSQRVEASPALLPLLGSLDSTVSEGVRAMLGLSWLTHDRNHPDVGDYCHLKRTTAFTRESGDDLGLKPSEWLAAQQAYVDLATASIPDWSPNKQQGYRRRFGGSSF